MDEKLLFFSTFLKYPKEIGSVIPSSKFLIDKLLDNIEFNRAKCIVEFGPGTGCITAEILKRARNDCKVLCFEINEKMYDYLKNNFKDKRLMLINDSAENIKKHVRNLNVEKVDYIVSGIPFSTLPNNKKSSIIKETKSTLKDNGKFVIYQFVSSIKKSLSDYFSIIYTEFIPLNIPPVFIYVCVK